MEMAMCVPDLQLHHQHEQQPTEQMNSRIKRKLLCLENYLAFLRSGHHQTFTCNQLNKIISIHGFSKLSNRKAVEEAIVKMKLIDPARSTLNENISSQAFMKLDETIKDLAALNWQECSITSIRSINSQNYSNPVSIPPITATRPMIPRSTQTIPTPSLSSSSGPSNSNEAGSGSSMAAGGSGNGGNKPLSLKRKRMRKSSSMAAGVILGDTLN